MITNIHWNHDITSPSFKNQTWAAKQTQRHTWLLTAIFITSPHRGSTGYINNQTKAKTKNKMSAPNVSILHSLQATQRGFVDWGYVHAIPDIAFALAWHKKYNCNAVKLRRPDLKLESHISSRCLHYTGSGAHNPERVTPILSPCHGVFTDRFIFRHISRHFFPRKWSLHHVYERIQSIRYQKGKLNVIKRQKISFLCL